LLGIENAFFSFVKRMGRTYEKERNHYTAEENVAILRRRLVDKAPVSDVGGFGVSRFNRHN
jgi:hypothetical protein